MTEAPDPEVVELATKIFDLARRGRTEELVAYVDAGVPADLTNDRGDSLVMLAAYHGHAEAVRALLARGADADRVNDRGQTPLAGAVFKGRPTSPRRCWRPAPTPPPGHRRPSTRPGCSPARSFSSSSKRAETPAPTSDDNENGEAVQGRRNFGRGRCDRRVIMTT